MHLPGGEPMTIYDAATRHQQEKVPLQFEEGESAETLGLTGRETFDIVGLESAGADMPLPPSLTVQAGGRAFTMRRAQDLAEVFEAAGVRDRDDRPSASIHRDSCSLFTMRRVHDRSRFQDG